MGRPLATKTQQRLLRLQFEMAAAEVRADTDLQSATAALNSVALEAEKRGIRGMVYEARLALGKAEMKYGAGCGRARLAGVEKDAASSGFVLLARKAGAFREGSPQTSMTWDLRLRASTLEPRGVRGFSSVKISEDPWPIFPRSKVTRPWAGPSVISSSWRTKEDTHLVNALPQSNPDRFLIVLLIVGRRA